MVMKMGLVGLGVMGANHARIISESKRVELAWVYDENKAVCEQSARRWGSKAASRIEDLDDCDAVVVATSTASHRAIAEHFLSSRTPMLLEKPLCSTLSETLSIIEAARKARLPLMCGFVERFNPAVVTAIRMIDGPVRHLSTFRHSPYNPRASSSVVTDLLIHDLDLTARVAPTEVPSSVGASLWKPDGHSFSETTDCTLQFGNQMTALHSASRWSQRKIREMRICTDNLLLELDLLRVTVTAFRHRSQGGGNDGDPMVYRSETMIEVPFVRHSGEPLALQFDHFLDIVAEIEDASFELDSIAAPHRLAELVERL
jgi:predicted dehydrogenase